ncbi:MAG: diguanylate cyclase [Candidatus Omnitrophica bacterium]|nr:diguanylate cyclase [Candidatus Omnitrophota bacterium]MBU4467685.1 diguanylate cyclase [Candidatus Omnitrophota bacterium]MCG2708000.1 diguanylate cyclase [Candidatus Omnitrophota bacterium]
MQQEINILVVEDDSAAAGCLESTLKLAGYHVWLAGTPQEGLEFLSLNTFPVVITELRSAKMNGVQFTRQAHKISAGTNILVLTPYSFVGSAIEAMEEGAYGYITKPLSSSEIRIVVERAVERYFLLSGSKDKEFLVDLAVRDGLTGLFNRRYFNELIMIEVDRLKRSPATLSVLMLDIDNFKNYNDTQGHQAGDILLKDAAKVFKNSVRPSDIVCRYGGEEFIIILPQTEKKAATIVAERLRVQVGLYLPTTVSIGIASVPEDAREISALIEKADSALYQAKAAGKNKWCAA